MLQVRWRGLSSELRGRSEYQHEYYEKTKERRKANYNAQTQYIRYVEIKKMLNRLRKEIGNASYGLILAELEKLERVKH